MLRVIVMKVGQNVYIVRGLGSNTYNSVLDETGVRQFLTLNDFNRVSDAIPGDELLGTWEKRT